MQGCARGLQCRGRQRDDRPHPHAARVRGQLQGHLCRRRDAPEGHAGDLLIMHSNLGSLWLWFSGSHPSRRAAARTASRRSPPIRRASTTETSFRRPRPKRSRSSISDPRPDPFGSRLFSRAELEDAAKLRRRQETPKITECPVRVVRKMDEPRFAGRLPVARARRAYDDAPRANAALVVRSATPARRRSPPASPTSRYDLGQAAPSGWLAHHLDGARLLARTASPWAASTCRPASCFHPSMLAPKIPRGSTVTLVDSNAATVEVSTTPAITTRDGDAGDVVQVTIRATGKRGPRPPRRRSGHATFWKANEANDEDYDSHSRCFLASLLAGCSPPAHRSPSRRANASTSPVSYAGSYAPNKGDEPGLALQPKPAVVSSKIHARGQRRRSS